MPGFPLPFVKFREVDSNGRPLVGGKLWSFAAGGSTPLATYTTQALNVTNLNPTILDASGRAAVFIPDGVGYKFILQDALGNELWSEDEISVPPIQATPATPIVPPGTIVAFGGATVPAGWLLCNGAPVPPGPGPGTYPDLFAAILYTYGGPGLGGTFNLPDLRQRFPLGKAASGVGVVLGATGGLIDHTHTITRNGWTRTSTAASEKGGFLMMSDAGPGTISTPTVDIATGTANPPFLAVNFIIKT